MTESAPALELRSIEKKFGATVALAAASLAVRRGTLHVLLGENGAGKTTLLDVAAGLQHQDAGEVLLDGQRVRWRSRREAMDAGVSAVHQHLSLVSTMTVSENVALGDQSIARRFVPRDAAVRVRQIADAAGLAVDPHAIVGDLSVAARQRAEIVKAIAHDPSVLLLDEPTSALAPPDIVDLFTWLRAFVARGHTAVVVTHRLREAMMYGDVITVLRAGRAIITADRTSLSERDVLVAMLGDPDSATRAELVERSPAQSDQPVRISLVNVSFVDQSGVTRLRDVTLAVRANEILGICGIEGAGQHALLRILAGRYSPSTGDVTLAQSAGFIPEDRAVEALINELSLKENFALRGAGARRGLIHWDALTSSTKEAIRVFDVRGGDPSTLAGTLSGGNQQRFVLAREFSDEPGAVVAENPTRGLDVRAAHAVFDRLRTIRNSGAAVVVYSSDVEEIVRVADRVIVCHAGAISEVPVEASAIGAAMVGVR